MNKRKFTPEEDSKICELVKQLGPRNWDLIATEVPGRTGRQCRDRYQNYLIPGYFNGQWTQEEDARLYMKFIQFGNKWTLMKKFFPGRTANSIKNRWNYFVCRNYESLISNQKMFNQCQNVEKIVPINQKENTYSNNDLNFEKSLVQFNSIQTLSNSNDDNHHQILTTSEGTQTRESGLLSCNFFFKCIL